MRERTGFPEWRKVSDWLNKTVCAPYPEPEIVKLPDIKNPEIPALSCYEGIADDSFWEFFPHRDLPHKAESKVNVTTLKKKIFAAKDKMAKSEFIRAKKLLKTLQTGAESFQKSPLPPVSTRNAASTGTYGRHLTDTIATWVKKGFVAGPFSTPPVPGFRVNPLGVVVRNGKARPILNMSGPIGASFNDNVEEARMEKLHMGTAKEFSFLLKDAGVGAKFSKFDIQDAYKLIPARTEDYRLQGFQWLGKYFVELKLSFGGKPSPTNFDNLGKTKDLLVCLETRTPRFRVPRALDDSPCVASVNSGMVERFSEEMKRLCGELNIPLAENCPRAEKAFELVTRGTVLGIGFDSSNMSWFLPKEKADKIIRRCLDAAKASYMDLKQVQKLMGSINDFSQLCPLLKPHKRSGNCLLAKFGGNDRILMHVPEDLKEDLRVIAKVAESARSGLPIAEGLDKPGLEALTFYSDAAGASFSLVNGQRHYHDNAGKGVSCIGGDDVNKIWGWSRLSWPEGLLTQIRDEKGSWFGSKTATLEAVGLIIPFIVFPEVVAGKHLVFKVDNAAVMWGWQSGYIKNDKTATEILKAVRYLGGFLGATIFVQHVGRMSDDMASLADELSRRSWSKNHRFSEALDRAEFRPTEGFLSRWLKDPCSGEDLLQGLLGELLS